MITSHVFYVVCLIFTVLELWFWGFELGIWIWKFRIRKFQHDFRLIWDPFLLKVIQNSKVERKYIICIISCMREIRQLFIAKALDESLLCKRPGENICRLRGNKSTDFILHSFYHFIPDSRWIIHLCTQIENGPQNEYRYFAHESPCSMSSPNLFNFQHTCLYNVQ